MVRAGDRSTAGGGAARSGARRWLVGWGLILLGCLPTSAAWSAVTCDASVNRTSVPTGGEIVLTVATGGDVDWSPNFELPDLPDVQVYAGGTSQSMSMINGRTETSVSRTFYLKVDRTGDFTIGPIKISGGKWSCETDPIRITVTAADTPPSPPPADTGNRTAQAPRSEASGSGEVHGSARGGKPGDEVFVTLEADHEEAWVGQQIVLTFRYWRRVQPWNNPNYTPPRTEGFWRENLGTERNSRRVLAGRAYNVTEIRYALFATRAGDLVIEPAELSFPRGAFDSFFRSSRRRPGASTLRTDPLTIHVKALPDPKPDNFSAIVASRLDLRAVVDRDSVPRGEALGLTVHLDADGFLKGFNKLQIPEPDHVRMHAAGDDFRTSVEGDRLIGHIKVETVLVPDREGSLTLPSVPLVWFDTTAGRYRTAQTAAREVSVTASDLPSAGDDQSGFLRSELSRLGEDLAFIHPVPASLSRRATPLTGRRLWWLFLLLPVLALGVLRILLQRLEAGRRDSAGRRRRGAHAAALRILASGSGDAMGRVAQAVCGYVAAWSDRPVAAVGPTEVEAYCRQVDMPDAGARLREILATCDAARYGRTDPGSATRLADETKGILAELDRRHRRRQGRATAGPTAGLLLLVVVGLTAGNAIAATEGPGPSPGTDPVRLLAEGNQAYTQGNLAEAESRYLAAVALGVNDAVLHFNLGNVYAREGHLGLAVASYLRAQRLAPRDPDIRSNLAWVRRHIKDLELSNDALPLFIAQLAGLMGWLTLDQWGSVLLGLVWLLAALLAWGWYRGEITDKLRRVLLGGAALLLLVAGTTGWHWYNEMVRESAVVVAPTVVVRSGPADDFSALFEVHDGLTLNIEERRSGWVRIGLGGDWEGWMPAQDVVPVRRTGSPGAALDQGR